MNHPKNEKTLVLIKPDGVQRSLIGEIISRLEKIGLKLIAMKMVVVDEGFVEKHYTLGLFQMEKKPLKFIKIRD